MLIELLVGGAIVYWLAQRENPSSATSDTSEATPGRAASRIITFVGAASSGKSSTANALLGRAHFAAGAEHGTTTSVADAPYLNGYHIRDTPGLLDDADYDDMIWGAIEESELVVYTACGQLYGPELAVLERIATAQRVWDERDGTPGHRSLTLFVNMQDRREQTMASALRQREAAAIRAQVAAWIPAEQVVFGAASPVVEGRARPAQVGALRAVIDGHIGVQRAA